MSSPDEFPKIEALIQSLIEIEAIDDDIQKEYTILEISKKLDIPVESFRSIFDKFLIQKQEERILKSRWKAPFFKIERGIESTANFLDRMDLFRVITKLASLSLIIGVITFVIEIPKRAEQQEIDRKRARYEAWQIVNSNEGKKSDGGRIDALRDLNEQGVSLAGINLDEAFLSGADLNNAMLRQASFNDALLDNADLSNSDLGGAKITGGAFLYGTNLSQADLLAAILDGAFFNETTNFSSANLSYSSLKGASFLNSNLRDSTLSKSDLTGAIFIDANLAETDLRNATLNKAVYNDGTQFAPAFNPKASGMFLIGPEVNLSNEDLSGVNFLMAQLENADLSDANFQSADSNQASLSGADISNADFRNAKNLTIEQIKSARGWQTAIFDEDLQNILGIQP